MNQSIFDKSFEVVGSYVIITKSGFKIFFSKRSAIWEDKFKSSFVTLELSPYRIGLHDDPSCVCGLQNGLTLDLRYNEIAGVMEF